MNISKMLMKESKAIKDNKDIGNRIDCTDILISVRFSDDHVHHIIPSQQITDKIIFDLLSYVDFKEDIVNAMIVKILTIYVENNDKEDKAFDEMISLLEKIKNKLVESKKINSKKSVSIKDYKIDIH